MKSVRIGLFGCSLASVNYGCSALALAQLKMLKEIEQDQNLGLEYWIFEDVKPETIENVKKILGVENLHGKYIVRFKTGIAGIRRLIGDVRSCDFVIDLTYGDSFSDIYGLKNFMLYSIPKLVCIREKKCLVLGPQTIGPFYSKPSKWIAKYIIKRADYVVARDYMSSEYANTLTGRRDIIQSSDLAMDLPFALPEATIKKGNVLNIGLNVSSLLWVKDSSNSKISVNLPYRGFMRGLLEEFRKRGYCVHLITHVFEDGSFTEYSLAEDLQREFSDIAVLAPHFSDPIEAKSYIAGMDLFIGARMHATIAAFSSGVPVIPVAYSRKFEGLYSTIGYNHCIDCGKETTASAIEKILQKIDAIQDLGKEGETALIKAKTRNEIYRGVLRDAISLKMKTHS